MPVDDADFRASLDALTDRLAAAGHTIANKGALIVQQQGMLRTKVISGTLRRSWRTVSGEDGPGVFSAFVGPTTVYARRQELGFMPPLKDSLGREFPQDPGWPYVRPALVASVPLVQKFAVHTLTEALHG